MISLLCRILAALSLLTVPSVAVASEPSANLTHIRQKAEAAEQAGEHARAIAVYAEALALYKEATGDYQEFARVLRAGGQQCYYSQRYIESLEFFTMSMDAANKCGDRRLLDLAMGNIGLIYDTFDDHERALYYFQRVYDSALKRSDTDLASQVLANIVTSYCNMKQPDEAKRYFRLLQQTPRKNREMNEYYLLLMQGFIAATEENHTAAIYYYRNALNHVRSRRMDSLYVTPLLLELGNEFSKTGRMDSAWVYYRKCEAMARENHTPAYLADMYKSLVGAYSRQGDTLSARKFAEKADSIEHEIYDRDYMKQVQNQLYKAEDIANSEKISSLSGVVSTQQFIIGAFVLFAAVLVMLLLLIHKQNKKQQASYRLLIAKNQELEEQQRKNNLLRDKYLLSLESRKHDGAPSDSSAGPSAAEARDDSAVRQEQTEMLLQRIEKVIDSPDFLFSPEANLAALCRAVGSNRTYVSNAINESYKKSFKALLNERRCREATRRLIGSDAYSSATVQDIALSLGYSSASSFIQAFKKVIGMTPANYKVLMTRGGADAQ